MTKNQKYATICYLSLRIEGLDMIRKIIKPSDNNLIIKIPDEYIGQEVEYIVFPINSNNNFKKNDNSDIESIGGSLSKYANRQKQKLEDSAWELHIIEKFQK